MTDLDDRFRTELAGRYRVVRELGRGGMATVFLAHDEHHDRSVALKVLSPDVAASLGAERFQREIRLAAKLQHPHILSVYDSGETAGRLWFTMPYVEGESLRDRLTRERQLPLADAVRITRETALALDFAHRHGVVHRDIKPENILLIDGQAMVADFGIARALNSATTDSITQTGMAVGTPGYMSPEQASGEHALDARTDVYSLGCVLYEMVAGEPPFTGATAQVVISRVLTEAPRSLTTSRQGVSAALDTVVRTAMSKVPADRYASAAEFARALEATTAAPAVTGAVTTTVARRGPRWLGVAVAAAVVFFLGVLAFQAFRRDASSVKRLAVLPFENEGTADDEYFADGVTDEIRSKLASIDGIEVTARSSTRQYKRSSKGPRDIGRELGVQYLLTGTVRWNRGNGVNRVRVTPELIQVSTAAARWSEPFDTVLSDVFDLQTNIASKVAHAMNVALAAPVETRIAKRPTSSLDAYDEFLKGEQITQSIGVSDQQILVRGLEHYERAVSLDSNFAQAWAQVARASAMIAASAPTKDVVERARVGAERAVALAPDRAEGHLAMASYLQNIKLDFAGAHEQLNAGLKISPRNADILAAIATLERSLGSFDDALAHALEARRIDPRSVAPARRVAGAYSDLRRYPEALRAWDVALALAPDNLALIHGKVFSLLSTGQLDSVHALVEQSLKTVDTTALLVRFAFYQETMWSLPQYLWPKIVRLTVADFNGDRGHWGLKVGNTWKLMGDTVRARAYGDSARLAFEAQLRDFPEAAQLHELRGRALALGGHRAEAIEEAERSLKLRETKLDASIRPYVHYQVARILIQSGEYERALDLIEPLLTTPASDLTPAFLRLEPVFRPLRGNPRFERLIAAK